MQVVQAIIVAAVYRWVSSVRRDWRIVSGKRGLESFRQFFHSCTVWSSRVFLRHSLRVCRNAGDAVHFRGRHDPVFFHLGNAALLPLLGQSAVATFRVNPAVYTAATVILAQLQAVYWAVCARIMPDTALPFLRTVAACCAVVLFLGAQKWLPAFRRELVQ